MFHPWSRRRFISQSLAAAGVMGSFPALTQTTNGPATDEGAEPPSQFTGAEPLIRVLLHDPTGIPLDIHHRKTLLARDLPGDPLPQNIVQVGGEVHVALAKEPLQLACRLKVPGFGEVYCHADNGGRGYSQPETIEFVVAAAATRLRRVRDALEKNQGRLTHDPELHRLLSDAARPIPAQPAAARSAAAYEALANGLQAGERLALNAARERIRRLAAPRHDFLFGCASSGWNGSPAFEKYFLPAFNYAATSWYIWGKEEPPEARIDYGRMDRSVQWCLDHKITPKGYGYVYLIGGALPEWLRQWPYEQVLAEYKRVVAQTTRRYGDRMPFVEVINEVHDKANLFRFSHAQILELTRVACQAAREGSPNVKRLINHCCLWAEYAQRPNEGGIRRWTPFRYLQDCVSHGVDFERVGLQLYYPQQDLFEIEAMLDRFKVFGRPIQITEIACNSVDGLDAASMRPKELVPGWHGPWTETQQAEWLEGIYTLCYSKPEFEGISWWDFADSPGHFWPSGGLLRADFSPKEAYLKLLELRERWGLAAR